MNTLRNFLYALFVGRNPCDLENSRSQALKRLMKAPLPATLRPGDRVIPMRKPRSDGDVA